jgi:hypothetical protein
MEIIKNSINQERKISLNTIDFKNSKSNTWNGKRRFGI